MVNLTTTPRIQSALEGISASQREQLELPTTAPTLSAPITHEQLLRLAKHLQNDTSFQTRSSSPTTVLSELLRGTKVYVAPPPKKAEPTPEYLASKARLLALQEEAAYQRLLHPTSHQHQQHDLNIYEHTPNGSSNESPLISEDTLTPSLVLNIFLSVLITGFSVYWALSKFSTPRFLATTFAAWTGLQRETTGGSSHGGQGVGVGASEPVRVLLALFAALAVAVAESFLYAAYLGKVERARVKERRMKERKVVVGRVETDSTDGDAVGVDGDQSREEIWGRGANGGVRRRVREKWQRERQEEEKEKETPD